MENPEKKIKNEVNGVVTRSPNAVKKSKIFSPFRVVGNVSDDTPHAVGTLGSTFYVVTSVGRSFQIYDVATLHLLFVSLKQTPSKINYLTAHFHYVFTAYHNKIGIYKRGQLECTVECPTKDKVTKILVFGEFLIASTTGSDIYVFKRPPGSKLPTEYYTTLDVINRKIDGEIVGLIHPPTYLNKIVVATTENIFVFNLKTRKMLFKSPESQIMEPISCIEAAPALDIIAVGMSSGSVSLYNIKKGKVLGKKIIVGSQSTRVTSISFRTDGSHHLVAGLSSGDLFFYDLQKGARIHILRNAHRNSYGGVANAKFLNGQPIVLTNGGDNNLKEFVFDPALSSTNSSIVSPPRHLRSRGGHSAPPAVILFPQEEKSHFILSGSRDKSFWTFSIRKDAQSQELSQRLAKTKNGKRLAGPVSGVREKFNEICQISCSLAREGEWDNILTAHKEETFARSWDLKNKRVGSHVFPTVDGGFVKAVCISHCGNFAMIGSSNGGIGSYNMQSGKLRKKFMLHKKAVTGIAIDGMNQKLVSCGLDGVVGFYDFAHSKYLGKLQLEAPITSMIYHKSSDLLACALDDLTVVVIDVITQKVIRILYGHTNRITGIDFSPDSKWLVSVSLDGTLRTWDLPTGGCIDGIFLPIVATSVRFSPIGDFLATTHVSGNGISLWTNRAQFKHVGTRHIEEEEFATALLPNVSGDGGGTLLEGALENTNDDDVEDNVGNLYKPSSHIDSSLVTLTLQPKEKYSTLLHLDAIKKRNKPIEPPKKPDNAPFFLSLSGSVVGDRAIEAENDDRDIFNTNDGKGSESESKLLHMKENTVSFESQFTRLLREGVANNYKLFLEFLVTSPPSTIDLEIRSLKTTPPFTEMIQFVKAISEGLKTNANYDIYQAAFSIFLKCHADVIHSSLDSSLLELLNEWEALNNESLRRLDELLKYCSGVISFVSTA